MIGVLVAWRRGGDPRNAQVQLEAPLLPVSRDAAAALGATPEMLGGREGDALPRGLPLKHEFHGDDTRLRLLSDIIPVRVGPLRAIMNIPDFLILAGIGIFAYSTVRAPVARPQAVTAAG